MNPTPIETGGKTVNPAIAELAALDRWVGWKSERRKGKDDETAFLYRRSALRQGRRPDDMGQVRSLLAVRVRRPCSRGHRLLSWATGSSASTWTIASSTASSQPWALEVVRQIELLYRDSVRAGLACTSSAAVR